MEEITSKLEKVAISPTSEKSNDSVSNKGTGAGGKNTNKLGKAFENLTLNEKRLIDEKGFIVVVMNKTKYGYYLYKKDDKKELIYLSQNGLKVYAKKELNIDLFRSPDEAYIIKPITDDSKKTIIKILEKKEQSVEGSVETKLWSGPSLKREYEIVFGEDYIIEYAYTLSKFLEDKVKSTDRKYVIFNQIMIETNINIFYGENKDYYEKLDEWIFGDI